MVLLPLVRLCVVAPLPGSPPRAPAAPAAVVADALVLTHAVGEARPEALRLLHGGLDLLDEGLQLRVVVVLVAGGVAIAVVVVVARSVLVIIGLKQNINCTY